MHRSYRRVLSQARLIVTPWLSGNLPDYEPLATVPQRHEIRCAVEFRHMAALRNKEEGEDRWKKAQRDQGWSRLRLPLRLRAVWREPLFMEGASSHRRGGGSLHGGSEEDTLDNPMLSFHGGSTNSGSLHTARSPSSYGGVRGL